MLLFDKNKIEDIEENDTNNYIYAPVQSDDEWKIQLVNELINLKHDKLVLDNLSKEEVDEIIEFLCTSCSSIFIILQYEYVNPILGVWIESDDECQK